MRTNVSASANDVYWRVFINIYKASLTVFNGGVHKHYLNANVSFFSKHAMDNRKRMTSCVMQASSLLCLLASNSSFAVDLT